MILSTPRPSTASSVSATRMDGMLSCKSTRRMMRPLTRPPRHAAVSPSTVPVMAANPVAANPTSRLVRSPYRIADSMSRPWSSVPSTYRKPSAPRVKGGSWPSSRLSVDRSYGFCGATSGANTAPATIAASTTTAPKVHQQVDGHEKQRDDHEVADHHRAVELVDAVDDQLAGAGPGKHAFRHHGKGDQVAELQPGDGHDGDRHPLQHVDEQDATRRQALGPGIAHEILAHRLPHAGPGQAQDQRHREQRQVQRRQQEVPQPVQGEQGQAYAQHVDRGAPSGGG